MAVTLKTFEQFVGGMIRTIVAETPLNDVNTGSVLFSLIEAIASNDFENAAAILNVLELLNIDVLRNNDLDARAADYGLTRLVAVAASGLVTITDSTITEISTSLYPIKPAPISGDMVLNVNDASKWAPTGQLYIGRGTNSFEGPIPYTGVTNNVTFWTITLSSALQNNHLISDVVVDGQGTTDRLIAAGTIVQIPANNINPAVQYSVLRDAVIPAGESVVAGVEVLALVAGSIGNASINTITSFAALPFTGATVTNTTSFNNGSDIETDDQLRNRIKAYPSTLARGTEAAILAAIEKLSDPVQNDQIESAVVTEPTAVGQPSIIYIDDGTGFQPIYQGQSVDNILIGAHGDEEFLQLANFPLPRPQVVNVASGPFALTNGMILRVTVDNGEETIIFRTSDFLNISSATLPEIVTTINDQSTIFKARLTNKSQNLLIYPTAFDAEIIQVATITVEDNPALWANNVLQFPTNPFSYIKLYQNTTLLKERQESATLVTAPFNTWNVLVASDLIISVDGTPTQDQSFTIFDFGGSSFSALTLTQWVDVFNTKFAGVRATALSSGQMSISSNGVGANSSLNILGGTLLTKWFPNGNVSAVGQNSDFELNRENGNLRILTKVNAGDDITAGAPDTKGASFSTATLSGTYNVSTDTSNRPAEMIIVADANLVKIRTVTLPVGGILTVSSPSANIMRILSNSTNTFLGVFATTYDYMYITNRGDIDGTGTGPWLDIKDCGLFKVAAKGAHTTPGVDTYIDLYNPQTVVGSYTVLAAEDIQAFYSDKYPQIYNGASTSNPPAATIQNIVDTINKNVVNVDASIFKTNSIKLTSSTETGGSIAIPVSVGNMKTLFVTGETQLTGNPSHIANRLPSQDGVTWFRPTAPVGGTLSPTAVWLGRYTYTDQKGSLTANAIPGVQGVASYSEILSSTGLLNTSVLQYDDIINFTKGNNRGLYRSIRQILSGDRVGTQFDLPTTSLDHVQTVDRIEVVESLQFNSNDSLVVIMDNNATDNTIDIAMARTGVVNAGSQSLSFAPTAHAFSANDADGEAGVDFGSPQVWSTTLNNTNFNDYRAWFRARNWYVSGGLTGLGTNGSMIIRATQYGPTGNNLRFAIDYPVLPNATATSTYQNNPFWTQVTYLFGSGTGRNISMSGGTVFSVSSLGSNQFRLSFSIPINLNTVMPGDVLSILSNAGVSPANSGQFSILAVNAGARTLDIYNPNGSPTAVGQPEIVQITTVGDVVGTSSQYTVTTIADVAGSLDGKYFLLEDQNGSVGVWFDETGHTSIPAGALAANRNIRVITVLSGDSNNTVAAKLATVLTNDGQFGVTYAANQVFVSVLQHGPYVLPGSPAGTSGFTVTQGVTGTFDDSLNGKYFILQEAAGSVAFWFQLNNNGAPRPLDGANRAVPITTVNTGDSANTVASKIAVAIAAQTSWTASALSNVTTVTDISNAARPVPSAVTSGFTMPVTQSGSSGVPETVLIASSFNIYPLTGTDVNTITTTVNANQTMMGLVAFGSPSLTITKATREEVYTPTGPGNYSTSLAYGHNPDPTSSQNAWVNFYDGTAWVMQFSNNNPNFTLKSPMLLTGVAPTIYRMDTTPNYDSATIGEFFKLIPTTLTNLEHQLTQKALSQLPIVADVQVADNFREVQIKSLQLGSAGAVEVVGGRANSAVFPIIKNTQVDIALGQSFLDARVAAFPDALSTGDTVMIKNPTGVNRLSRLSSSDTINVVAASASIYEYRYNGKQTFFSSPLTIAITDVSASYSRPAGTVWRWTHDAVGGATLAAVVPGDIVSAFGVLTGWAQTNRVAIAGDGKVSGFPIIAVNNASNYFDVVNPNGVAMSATAIGALSTVQINPSALIKWNLTHAARTQIVQIVVSSGVATVTTASEYFLNTGDTFNLQNSVVVPVTTPLTPVTGTLAPNQFTFATSSPNGTYMDGGSILKNGTGARQVTRYRVESLGFNNLFRLAYVDGSTPGFADNGVAVDDLLILGGSTFNSNNTGTFRIRAVDNHNLIYQDVAAQDQLNTDNIPFNNTNTSVSWTASSNTVTGVAGSFANLVVGDSVKKQEDSDSLYLQVTGFFVGSTPTTAALATSITLDSNYNGITGVSLGSKFDMANDVDKGIYLQAIDDVIVLEGDSIRNTDTLFIASISDSSWFTINNTGTYTIKSVGTSGDYKPYLRVDNSAGTAQAGVDMSVDIAGLTVIEGLGNEFSSIRQIQHIAIDQFNNKQRVIYMTPADRAYKFSQSNNSEIVAMGKLDYSTDVTTGVDGYLYYTGLLQRTQRTIDGFEPDADTFPGYRAIGAPIELLPPLIRNIVISISVVTNNGVNLSDITNEIQSAIINYVNGLGVGNNVILSAIIAAVMGIKGVQSCTFTNPTPSTVFIPIADIEKAYIQVSDISISS
jgi:uncharacterized phage protein gp47/JayE